MTARSAATRVEIRPRRRWRAPALASGTVAAAVFVANAIYLLGFRSNNPLLYHSGLGSPTRGSWPAPFSSHRAPHTLDPNDGWTAQALGRLAAQMWSHGEVPLWNLHEGLGSPLAGEMQSGAFFLPFVLLQLLPNGIFVMHVVLELVAGLTTLAFLRRLGLGWVPSVVGGILFGVNGAFAFMTNAPFHPIAFLPMALWGIELIRRDVLCRKLPAVGVTVVALGLAWMLYAGFPETALLEGLLVALWTLVRVAELPNRRWVLAGWSLAGAVAGAILAAPFLVAMKSFLGYAFTAYHAGGSASWSYDPWQSTALAAPYLAGPFSVNRVLGGTAGFVTLPAVFLAIVGFTGKRSLPFRLMTGLTLVLFVANSYRASFANTVLNWIPGMSIVLIYKYGLILIIFLIIMLAAFGLDDIRRRAASKLSITVAALACATYLAVGLWYAASQGKLHHPKWTALVLVWMVLALGVLVLASLLLRRGARPALLLALAAVVGLDGVGSYMVPQLMAGRPARVDTAPITYLKNHLGTSRFFSLGPIQPNYGSYWGLSQLNVNDLPVPQKFRDYVINELKPKRGTPAAGVTGWAFTSGDELAPLNFNVRDAKGILKAYGQQQHAYREAGVEYLVMGHGVAEPSVTKKLGLTKVFSSKKTEIWRDPAAATSMTTSGGPCEMKDLTLESVSLTCTKPALVTRRQLAVPGWYASVNGKTSVVSSRPSELYQHVHVPAGTSTVRFFYRPAHFRSAVALSLATLAILIGGSALSMVRGRKRRDPAEGGSDAITSANRQGPAA